jgi:hypothetical protein
VGGKGVEGAWEVLACERPRQLALTFYFLLLQRGVNDNEVISIDKILTIIRVLCSQSKG